MANIFDWYKQGLSGAIQTAKRATGLEHTNLFPGDVNKALTGTPATQIYGSPLLDPRGTGYGVSPQPTISGSVKGVYTTGGGGGTVPSGSTYIPPDTGQLENTQGQVMDEIDAAIQMGMQALDQYQSTIQPSADLQVKEAESSAQLQRNETEAEKASRMGELGGQRTSAEAKTGSAIAESRRMASQLQQGIQARHGGSTHLGGAVSEVMGSQATANISQNRAALQETLGKITQAEEQVKTAATNMLDKINQNLALAKEQALNWVRTAMAEVNSQRASLAGDKAKMRMDVIMHYQDAIASLNETWRQEQNTITQKAQEASTQLSQWQQSLLPSYSPETQSWTAQGIQLGDTGQQQYYVPTIKGYTTKAATETEDKVYDPVTGTWK